jgi:DNA repair exonuclease SbcCD ATPase subunit
MISITVSNFRGCARAQIECAPIALLGGLNAAGKSSIAQAAGAALTGNALPVPGLRANAAGTLVHTGAASGTVEVMGDDGRALVEWPSARLTSDGKAPAASPYAVGLETIVTLAAKERLRVLAEYLHADPTREELGQALDEAEMDASAVLKTIWPAVERDGWDATVSARRERGAELKGMWRHTTGANYGSRIAATWRPDLADLDERDLTLAVSNAQTARDNAISASAVSDAERRRLEDEAELYDARIAALERATARVEEYRVASQAAQGARAALPPASAPVSFPCPHCSMPLIFVKASLVETRVEKPEIEIDNAELKRRRDAIALADGAAARAYDDLNEARRDVAAGEKAVRDSLDARQRLDNWPGAVEAGTDIATAEAQLKAAESRLAEFRTKKEADRLHRLVEGNEIVIALLSPDGLRATKLAQLIDLFNAEVDALCETARWSAVRLDDAGGIAYGGRPYGLASTSEQYRVRVTLAVAMAKLDGSELVILDGADILDAPSRSGLLTLLDKVKIAALICMTLPRREMLPDLAAAGMGQSYWLAGGTTESIGERVAA